MLNKYFLAGTLCVLVLSAQPSLAQNSDRSAKPQSVLITGANSGIGLALAKRFQQAGYAVIGTARKPAAAVKLQELGVQIEQLDVADQASVDKLRETLAEQAIHILINNAGTGGHSTGKLADLNVDRLRSTFDVNSLGALRVTQAVLANLRTAKQPIVASISSAMASISRNRRGCCYGYRASKSALNSINKTLALEFADEGFIFTVFHPGWVRTDMTSQAATYSPEQSAAELFKIITNLTDKQNGQFLDLFGVEIPW
jgi:NAD(P)-dependent dehydrogenase (short-subunit alcohol dehydrogenase family)